MPRTTSCVSSCRPYSSRARCTQLETATGSADESALARIDAALREMEAFHIAICRLLLSARLPEGVCWHNNSKTFRRSTHSCCCPFDRPNIAAQCPVTRSSLGATSFCAGSERLRIGAELTARRCTAAVRAL